MSYTHTIEKNWKGAGREIKTSNNYTGAAQQGINEPSIVDGVLDQLVVISIDVSEIKSIFILSSKDIRMETNSVAATGILTLAANAADGETVTIDTKVYTFQDTLSDSDGNVKVGANASDSIDNLIAAITLGSGGGTLYAASMTLHPTVTAVAGDGDTMDATAKDRGTVGNSIVTTETLATGGSQWAAGQLSGGTGPGDFIDLKAGKPYIWHTDSYFTNKLTVDVTALYLTNASGAASSFQLEVVTDPTP